MCWAHGLTWTKRDQQWSKDDCKRGATKTFESCNELHQLLRPVQVLKAIQTADVLPERRPKRHRRRLHSHVSCNADVCYEDLRGAVRKKPRNLWHTGTYNDGKTHMQSHAYTQSHTQLSTPAHCTPQQNDSLMRNYEKLKWVGFEGLEMFGGSGCRSAKNLQPFTHLGIGRMNSGRAVRSSEPCPHIHSAHVCMCMMCMYTS